MMGIGWREMGGKRGELRENRQTRMSGDEGSAGGRDETCYESKMRGAAEMAGGTQTGRT